MPAPGSAAVLVLAVLAVLEVVPLVVLSDAAVVEDEVLALGRLAPDRLVAVELKPGPEPQALQMSTATIAKPAARRPGARLLTAVARGWPEH